MLNTAGSVWLNATFRNRLAALARRTRNLVRREPLLQAGMYLVGTVYNFCTFHANLTQDGLRRTPAMAAEDGSLLECGGIALVPGSIASLEISQATGEALQGATKVGSTMGNLTRFKRIHTPPSHAAPSDLAMG